MLRALGCLVVLLVLLIGVKVMWSMSLHNQLGCLLAVVALFFCVAIVYGFFWLLGKGGSGR